MTLITYNDLIGIVVHSAEFTLERGEKEESQSKERTLTTNRVAKKGREIQVKDYLQLWQQTDRMISD